MSLPASLTQFVPSLDRLKPVLAVLEAEQKKRLAERRLTSFRPYAKQFEFFAAGATHRERLLCASNQFGKTVAGGAETAMHLTGRYPDWWPGHRFDRPIRMWGASITGDATRDNVQAKLVGPPESESEWGTGFIPKSDLVSWDRASGTPNLLNNIVVRHVSGGISTIGFKTYDQGRMRWQGPTLDAIWLDEEPPLDVYTEGLTRTNAVADSRLYITFTPLLGMSDVVSMFFRDNAHEPGGHHRND
jgi:phage terminase large subunit-like protein